MEKRSTVQLFLRKIDKTQSSLEIESEDRNNNIIPKDYTSLFQKLVRENPLGIRTIA